ncbi:MAG: hypothetical protein R2877_00965 [Bdellovibrionota bacterium]
MTNEKQVTDRFLFDYDFQQSYTQKLQNEHDKVVKNRFEQRKFQNTLKSSADFSISVRKNQSGFDHPRTPKAHLLVAIWRSAIHILDNPENCGNVPHLGREN